MLKVLMAGFFMLVSAVSAHAQENGKKSFLEFFSTAIRVDQLRGKDVVWRWPDSIIACVFGDYSAYDKKLVSSNINLIKAASNQKIELSFNGSVEGCPISTILYMRFHKKSLQARQLIWDDLQTVDSQKQRETDTPLSKISDLGAIVYSYGGPTPPYIFIAARSSESGLGPHLVGTTEEIVQKSLYLAITGIPDQFRLREFPTFLRDPISTISEDEGALFDRNVRRANLCELDLRFLVSLYAPIDDLLSPMEYNKYIQQNYNNIKIKSEKLYDSNEFRRIITKKC